MKKLHIILIFILVIISSCNEDEFLTETPMDDIFAGKPISELRWIYKWSEWSLRTCKRRGGKRFRTGWSGFSLDCWSRQCLCQ